MSWVSAAVSAASVIGLNNRRSPTSASMTTNEAERSEKDFRHAHKTSTTVRNDGGPGMASAFDFASISQSNAGSNNESVSSYSGGGGSFDGGGSSGDW